MQVFNFAESNSVLNQYVAEIRDVAVQTDRLRFRRNIERIGELMAYKMSKHLSYSVKQVQTPLGHGYTCLRSARADYGCGLVDSVDSHGRSGIVTNRKEAPKRLCQLSLFDVCLLIYNRCKQFKRRSYQAEQECNARCDE